MRPAIGRLEGIFYLSGSEGIPSLVRLIHDLVGLAHDLIGLTHDPINNMLDAVLP